MNLIKILIYLNYMFDALRAMLSPPRLPALCIAFHAGAYVTSERASTGLTHA